MNTVKLPPRKPREMKAYPEYSIKKVMNLIQNKCGNAHIIESHGNGSNKVIILPEAMLELKAIISYGRKSPMNACEQKFAGFGHYLRDNGTYIIIVKHFIQIHTMNRSPVSASNLGPNGELNPGLDFLEYYREEFLSGEKKYNTDAYGNVVDPFIDICGQSEFVLEGHTHPDLGVFYSGPDKISGAARAACSPVCTFVCDPIRKAMLGSIGKDFQSAEVIVYSYSEPLSSTPGIKSQDIQHLAPQVTELIHLASKLINSDGYKGNIRLHTHWGGNRSLKIKLNIPDMKQSD